MRTGKQAVKRVCAVSVRRHRLIVEAYRHASERVPFGIARTTEQARALIQFNARSLFLRHNPVYDSLRRLHRQSVLLLRQSRKDGFLARSGFLFAQRAKGNLHRSALHAFAANHPRAHGRQRQHLRAILRPCNAIPLVRCDGNGAALRRVLKSIVAQRIRQHLFEQRTVRIQEGNLPSAQSPAFSVRQAAPERIVNRLCLLKARHRHTKRLANLQRAHTALRVGRIGNLI